MKTLAVLRLTMLLVLIATSEAWAGEIVAWGRNGDGDVAAGNDFIRIAGGAEHCLALTPEPTTLAMLTLGGLAVVRKQERYKRQVRP